MRSAACSAAGSRREAAVHAQLLDPLRKLDSATAISATTARCHAPVLLEQPVEDVLDARTRARRARSGRPCGRCPSACGSRGARCAALRGRRDCRSSDRAIARRSCRAPRRLRSGRCRAARHRAPSRRCRAAAASPPKSPAPVRRRAVGDRVDARRERRGRRRRRFPSARHSPARRARRRRSARRRRAGSRACRAVRRAPLRRPARSATSAISRGNAPRNSATESSTDCGSTRDRLRRFAEALRDQRRDDPFAIGALLLAPPRCRSRVPTAIRRAARDPPRRPACRDSHTSRSAVWHSASRRSASSSSEHAQRAANLLAVLARAPRARTRLRVVAEERVEHLLHVAQVGLHFARRPARAARAPAPASTFRRAAARRRRRRACRRARRRAASASHRPAVGKSGDRLLKFSNALSASSSAVANSIASGSETPSAGMLARRATSADVSSRQRRMLDLRRLRIGRRERCCCSFGSVSARPDAALSHASLALASWSRASRSSGWQAHDVRVAALRRSGSAPPR